MSQPKQQLLLGDGGTHFRTLPPRREGDAERSAAARARIREEAARVVAFIGPKQAAAELGTQVSALSHMLAGRGQRYLRLDWAEYLAPRAPDTRFAEALVAPAGLVVIPEPTVTPEDERDAALEVAAELLSSEMTAVHRERTRQRALERARRRNSGGGR